MKSLIYLTFLAGLLAGGQAAQTNSAARPEGNRYLFVVDTSYGMRRLDLPNRQTVFDLVYFGVDHQMRSGDTFGLWTCDAKLHSGEFPMQLWESTNTLQVASRAATFLKQKGYSGKCDLQPVIMSIQGIAKVVKDVNVFILSNGETEMRGTPFDTPINTACKQRAAERKKAEKPFITTLVVRDGAITNAYVTLPGEKIDLPLPPPPAPVMAGTNAPAKRGQLISQRDLDENPDTASAQLDRPPAQPLIMKGLPVPVSPTGTVLPDSKSLTYRATNQTQIVSTAPEAVTNNTPPSVSTTVAVPAPENTTPGTEGNPVSSTNASSTVLPAATTPTVTIASAVSPGNILVPASKEVAAPPTAAMAHAAPLGTAGAEKSAPLGPGGADPARQMLATATPRPLINPQLLIIVGCVLLATALGLLLLVFRRVRRLPEPSIITRSMEKR